MIPVQKVACVDLDGYQARRRAIFAGERHTPRVTEATFQDRLGRFDAPTPTAAREEERDVRVLEVDWHGRALQAMEVGGGRVLERDFQGLA